MEDLTPEKTEEEEELPLDQEEYRLAVPELEFKLPVSQLTIDSFKWPSPPTDISMELGDPFAYDIGIRPRTPRKE